MENTIIKAEVDEIIQEENDSNDVIEYVEYECYLEEVVETEEVEAPEYVEEEYIIDGEEFDESEESVQYQCDKCFQLFDKHYSLERHMQIDHNQNCEEIFIPNKIETDEDDDELTESIIKQEVSGDDPSGVEEEEEEVDYEEIEFNVIGEELEITDRFTCDTCYQEFECFDTLSKHKATVHKRERFYKCSVCTKMYRSRNSLYKHFHHYHTNTDTCTACNEQFTDIIEHVKYHHGEKCPVCEKHFFDLNDLNEHIVSTHVAQVRVENVLHESPELKCNICSRHFKNMIHLQAHIRRSHSKEKILECPLCGKQFKSANSFTCYTSHINIHTGEKPYKCQYCSKTFGNSGTLHKHKKIHTGENFHRCKLCDKKFRDASYLTRHLKSCSPRNTANLFA